MAKTRRPQQRARATTGKQEQAARRQRDALRRAVAQQAAMVGLSKQLQRVRQRAAEALEELRVALNEESAAQMVAAAAAEERHGENESLRRDVSQGQAAGV